jgi:hypothetical protein
MSSKPAFWRVLACLSFVVGAGVIVWWEWTREVGDSSNVASGIGGALVGLSVVCAMRAKLISQGRLPTDRDS